jgi:protein-L-isoaspartate(D-aspartate) O-methyltransferase
MKAMTEDHLAILRRHMVELIAMQFDLLSDEIGADAPGARVAEAMQRVPRHLFVPTSLAAVAYENTPLPIGFDKTISQPFIAALMTHLLDPQPEHAVLEIGTGLGYQTAVLAQLARHVWTVDVVEEFAVHAEMRLKALGCGNVTVRIGDGTKGWVEHAPFDKVLVTAAAERIPDALVAQLRPGGRLVMPIGPEDAQRLTVADKDGEGALTMREVMAVRFGRLETGA